MNADTATAFITTNKGEMIAVQTADGNHFGEALSVNSKGVNIKVDGKTRSFALSRVVALMLDDVDADINEGDEMSELEALYAELHDGMSTAELAALLADHLKMALTPKELRVHLRALGLGVGKGRKYSLSASEFNLVKNLIVASA
jgi:hypothetical protein